MLKGKTIEEAKLIKDKDIADALELPPIKLHCSVLAEDSINEAIKDWEDKLCHK
jgi:nitrogen fixation NifU-like protein